MSINGNMTFLKFVTAFALCLTVACGGGHMYVNEEADLGFYSRVGVLNFSNLTADRNASQKVTNSFVTELLMLKTVSVVNSGDFNKAATVVIKQDMASALDELTSEQAVALGLEAGVEGIFVGAVKDFGMVRSGQEEFPLISVIVRFIDCQSGRIVWSYETSRKGGPKFPIFSFGETHTLGEMTTKVAKEVAQSFGRLTR